MNVVVTTRSIVTPPDSITVTAENNLVKLLPGEKVTLTSAVKPDDAVNTVNWSSEHAEYAKVEVIEGVPTVTAVAPGKTKIIATSTISATKKGEIEITVMGNVEKKEITFPSNQDVLNGVTGTDQISKDEKTFTSNEITFGYKNCYKFTRNNYLMMYYVKDEDTCLYNKDAMPGKIERIIVKTTSSSQKEGRITIGIYDVMNDSAITEKGENTIDGGGKGATVILNYNGNGKFFNITNIVAGQKSQIQSIEIVYSSEA